MYISEKVLESLSVTVNVFDTLSVTLPFEFCDDPVDMSGCVMVDVGVCVRARVSVRFIFVCVRVRVVVSLGKVHNRAAQRSLSREEVGQGHSQPLSLII